MRLDVFWLSAPEYAAERTDTIKGETSGDFGQ
jgi:hypothetical protein